MKLPLNNNVRLTHIPMNKRVFIYDAVMILEFLEENFKRTGTLIKPEHVLNIGAHIDIKKFHMEVESDYDSSFMEMKKFYQKYCEWRSIKPYTAPVEKYYRFSLIIKKMLLPKNGWQFTVKRVGRVQLVVVGPLVSKSP